MCGDSVTVPDFFENRFRDKSHLLMGISSVAIVVFFVPYTASGFAACGISGTHGALNGLDRQRVADHSGLRTGRIEGICLVPLGAGAHRQDHGVRLNDLGLTILVGVGHAGVDSALPMFLWTRPSRSLRWTFPTGLI